MKEVLPIIIFCCVGIALCVGYLGFLLVRTIKGNHGKHVECFDFDENTLTIDLTKRKK
jgi:hypothetical protein